MSMGTLVYSTQSGLGQTFIAQKPSSYNPRSVIVEEFCFICGRPTDHSGEHEDGVTVSSETITDTYVIYTTYVKHRSNFD